MASSLAINRKGVESRVEGERAEGGKGCGGGTKEEGLSGNYVTTTTGGTAVKEAKRGKGGGRGGERCNQR